MLNLIQHLEVSLSHFVMLNLIQHLRFSIRDPETSSGWRYYPVMLNLIQHLEVSLSGLEKRDPEINSGWRRGVVQGDTATTSSCWTRFSISGFQYETL